MLSEKIHLTKVYNHDYVMTGKVNNNYQKNKNDYPVTRQSLC